MRLEVSGEVAPMNLAVFEADGHGRTYGDVLTAMRKELSAGLAVMNSAHAQLRMEDAERHFERPAITGVVLELEAIPAVRDILRKGDGRAERLKMALGAAARIVMEHRGWKKLGRKTAVGVGEFFKRAERYED